MLKALRCPSVCHVCGAWPSASLCANCIERYAQPVQRCPVCALTWHDAHHAQCPIGQTSALDACVAAVSYAFPWDRCVADFKFKADPALGRCLANLMQHAPRVEPALERADFVIAMPLSAQRLRERGFNQAYELAKRLAPKKAWGHALKRVVDGVHQVGSTKHERLNLGADTFWVHPKELSHLQQREVVLVDDVMTTGATLKAAAQTLKTAGVSRVTGLVFARAELR